MTQHRRTGRLLRDGRDGHIRDSLVGGERSELLARRLAALQALGEDLAQAQSTGRIVDLLVAHGKAALVADGAATLLIDHDRRRLAVLGAAGRAAERSRQLTDLDLDIALPVTEAARTGISVFIEDPRELSSRYGATYRDLGLDLPPVAVAAVPIELEGRRFGVLAFSWDGHHDLPRDRRGFVESIARMGAGALDRARLFEQEQTSFRRLKAAQGRLDLLSEAGRVLGLSLDYESTLRRVASLAIPMLGDVCIVDIVEGERIRRLVSVADESLSGAASALERNAIRLGGDCPINMVLESGESMTYRCDVERPRSGSHVANEAAALRTIGGKWVHVAPLRTLDRTIGALTFLRRDDRGYDPDECATALQIADRAAHALENSRLHQQVRRLAERESRRAGELEAVIGAVAEGFLVVDVEGVVQSSNAAASRLLGGPVPTLNDLLGRLIGEGRQSPSALPDDPTEYRLRHRPSAWVEVGAYPVARAGLAAPSTVVVCRDVTAFRQGQALREAFMGLLSHELRTPVTTIYGGAAVLTRRGGHLDDETAAAVLNDIAAEADRLYRLVEDLLVLARFDEGFEVGQEPVLLQRLVPTVVDQERSRWPATRFELRISADLPAASGDETSITQVLRNLLSNASKYSGANTTIEVIVAAAMDGPAVRVLDQGPGIDPGEAEHLFDPFYRAPSTASLASGAGIGLYVSRRLVDAMGGRIWAAPRPERGSEFGFALPRYAPDEESVGDGELDREAVLVPVVPGPATPVPVMPADRSGRVSH